MRPSSVVGLIVLLAMVAALAPVAPAVAPSAPRDDLPYFGAAMDPAVARMLQDSSRPVRQDGSRGLQRARLAGEKAPETLNAIVMMCDFADSLMLGRHGQVPGQFPAPRQTDRYYAAHDSLFFDHLLGKVADYFTTVSGGRLAISHTVHPRTVNLPEPMSFYGNHPEFGEQSVLLAAAVVAAVGAAVDLSVYDTFVLVHAGAGEETDILGNSPEQIFSTYLDPDDFAAAARDSILPQPYLPAPGFPDGQGIDRVLILPETEQQDPVGSFRGGFGSLGVYCFEFGLHLGMLSLSDFTPSGRPDSQGIGQYGLMGYGLFVGLGYIPPHPCAFNKLLMGWLDPYEAVPGDDLRYALTPSSDPTGPLAAARVDLTGQEYWLLEYRLQDPNGDRRYTFGDDKNGNGIPDFYDADSGFGDGTPTGVFDAETDAVERVFDAEWDFAMSENNARAFGELGWGSGVYVWHINEGVIESVYGLPNNLFNADPTHKAVDLEEADGIQDLDSNQPSDFLLGGDRDSFRGEDAPDFLPTTLPRTDTAAGVFSGVEFRRFSRVVVDSFLAPLYTDPSGVTYWAFDYADTMMFDLRRAAPAAGAPVLHARRDLPGGVDLRGSHVLVGDLDLLGADDEIILAGRRGEVFVLDGDLNEFLDRDANPASLAPFAVGTRDGQPVAWNLPPALGDIDGDGRPEIVLTGADGIYAFEADGTAVRTLDPGSIGLYAAAPGCVLPPVLVPVEAGGKPAADVAVRVLTAEGGGAGSRLVLREGPTATETGALQLPGLQVTATPLLLADLIVVALADTVNDRHELRVVDWQGDPTFAAPRILRLPLRAVPGRLPLQAGLAPGSTLSVPEYFVVVIGTAGQGETVFFDAALRQTRSVLSWPSDLSITSPVGPGGAFVGEDWLGRVGHGGDWQTGWPRRQPSGGLVGRSAHQAVPLVGRLLGSPHRLDQFVFVARDGRIFGTGNQGEPESHWPLAGPASAGTPAFGRLAGFPAADLVAIGSFDRIGGTGTDGRLQTQTVSTVMVWRDVAAANPVFPMYGGSIWRNGAYDLAAWGTGPGAARGEGLVAGSHYCYPSPLGTGNLKVSGRVRGAGRARAEVYNLEGELVGGSEWRDVGAVDPFVIEMGLPGVVSGMYLCRLVIETANGSREQSVTQIAVVR